jgi:hypothetical protein
MTRPGRRECHSRPGSDRSRSVPAEPGERCVPPNQARRDRASVQRDGRVFGRRSADLLAAIRETRALAQTAPGGPQARPRVVARGVVRSDARSSGNAIVATVQRLALDLAQSMTREPTRRASAMPLRLRGPVSGRAGCPGGSPRRRRCRDCRVEAGPELRDRHAAACCLQIVRHATL